MIPVTLAVEDAIGEALVHRVILQRQLPLAIEQVLQQRGISYLRSRADSLNKAAHGGVKSIILADSDSSVCPVTLANAWFPNGRHDNLAFRFCVHEGESWILADVDGFSDYLGISHARIPNRPDEVVDAKSELVALARRSPRGSIRAALVPSPGSVVLVGPSYNSALTQFIRLHWSFERAVQRSPSLSDFSARLDRLCA